MGVTKLLIKDIFIDTDCLSSFLWVGYENLLSQLYPGRLIIPKPVYEEINRPVLSWMRVRVDSMINSGNLTMMELLFETKEFELYYKLTEKPDKGHKIIGNGEASSIALAVSRNGIVASNNFNDTLSYINEYSLEYTTTADILVDAYKRGIIDVAQGNFICSKMLKKRRRLGASSFSDYLNNHL